MQVSEQPTARNLTSLMSVLSRLYFSAPPSKEAVLVPPLACTNCVRTGTNFPTMSGERPNFSKAPATETKLLVPPGRESARPESPENPPDEDDVV